MTHFPHLPKPPDPSDPIREVSQTIGDAMETGKNVVVEGQGLLKNLKDGFAQLRTLMARRPF